MLWGSELSHLQCSDQIAKENFLKPKVIKVEGYLKIYLDLSSTGSKLSNCQQKENAYRSQNELTKLDPIIE